MDVQHFQPQSELLRQHIEYYYFLRTDDPGFQTEYYAFPNLLISLNLHANVAVDIKDHSIAVSGGERYENRVAIVQGLRRQPLKVSLSGTIDKITIVFKPLGLAAFVKKTVAKICSCDSQMFTEWDEIVDYQQFLPRFFQAVDQMERIDLLERFLLSRHQPVEEHSRLRKAMGSLTDFQTERSVEEVAAQIGINVRTFSRLFKENVGISPAGFKKIARFRHSLNNKMFSDNFERLTDVAYDSNFYDQSYFINIYKQMTGSNPKRFFDRVEKVGAEKLLFQFLDR
ncbi:MAG: helix-turn-helix domain-containing protein [Pyrinomonadaceae bacterium]